MSSPREITTLPTPITNNTCFLTQSQNKPIENDDALVIEAKTKTSRQGKGWASFTIEDYTNNHHVMECAFLSSQINLYLHS